MNGRHFLGGLNLPENHLISAEDASAAGMQVPSAHLMLLSNMAWRRQRSELKLAMV